MDKKFIDQIIIQIFVSFYEAIKSMSKKIIIIIIIINIIIVIIIRIIIIIEKLNK